MSHIYTYDHRHAIKTEKQKSNIMHEIHVSLKTKHSRPSAKVSFRHISLFLSFYHLELALLAAGDNDVVDLEHHAAELGGEQELLALGDERVDDESGLHVCEE